jgi:hypothetical protein
MAWYNSSKDLSKKLTPSKTVTAVATGGLSTLKPVGDAWSAAVKQPTAAIGKSIATGNAQPIKTYAGNMWAGGVKNPIKKIGEMTGITPKQETAGPMSAATAGPDYSQNKLALTAFGNNLSTDYGSMIGANEDPNAVGAGIRGQFSALGSLAKMREGAQSRTEQSAIQRRLAASGMSGSGAGMRMAQQAQGDSARRSAETGLGLAAQQFGAEQGAMEAATGRNMQREQMRVGAAESAAGREFAVQQANRQAEQQAAQFELDKSITAENQKIARSMQRYNEQGMIGQLFTDILGKPLSFGSITGRK